MYVENRMMSLFSLILLLIKDIPMETLEPMQPNQIRLLYYINPSRFYVYLREKTAAHISVNLTILLRLKCAAFFHQFQNDLQVSIQKFGPISSPRRYQPIAAQDNRALWHRAIILGLNEDEKKLFSNFFFVFFLKISVLIHQRFLFILLILAKENTFQSIISVHYLKNLNVNQLLLFHVV